MPGKSSSNVLSILLQLLLTLAAFAFVFSAFVVPNRIAWFDSMTYFYLPLELFVLGLALLLRGNSGRWLRAFLAVILAAGVIFRIADMSAFQVFARPFNPVFDTYLLADGFHFLTTSFGQVAAIGVAVLLCVLVCGIVIISFLSLARLHQLLQVRVRLSTVMVLTGLLVWISASSAGWPRASRYFYDQFAMHVANTITSIRDLREFRTLVNVDAYAETPGDALFSALRGKDVLVVFVESYGRTLLDKAEYSEQFAPFLNASTKSLESAGFQSRSAFLTSPTVGGISWLAHGTALSGLWIDSQVRYDSLMMSERPSLVRLFQRAGWRTVGVMPAISMAWPEGDYFGYEQLYTAPELEYRGAPYNYVTMPDQFTFSQFQKFELNESDRRPVMAELALVSSHAPWTPVATLIDWADVGDGSVFIEEATSGDAAEVVWQSRDRVLKQFRESIEYVLSTISSFAQTFGGDDLVILVIGDHQPMPYVTDNTESRDVFVHLIAKDPAVMAAVEHWQWSEGMLPESDAPVWRMDEVRDRFIQAFSQ